MLELKYPQTKDSVKKGNQVRKYNVCTYVLQSVCPCAGEAGWGPLSFVKKKQLWSQYYNVLKMESDPKHKKEC